VILGYTQLCWVSDYAQFYVLDTAHLFIEELTSLGEDDFARGFSVASAGLAIYTADSLTQVVRILIHDGPPPAEGKEPVTGDLWTKTAEVAAAFPSSRFTIGGPTGNVAGYYGPWFNLPSTQVRVRISWLEDIKQQYTLSRAKPDLIQLDFWPVVAS
jgi:hypothetical protein